MEIKYPEHTLFPSNYMKLSKKLELRYFTVRYECKTTDLLLKS